MIFASILLLFAPQAHAWVSGARPSMRLFPLSNSINQAEVSARISSTDRGRSVSDTEKNELESYFSSLEEKCALPEPARSPLVEGSWVVEYTTAPPPSNGQLGPFAGIAYQEIELDSGRYANILKVPPNDWLSATLEASWEEWDGVLVEDARDGKGWKSSDAEEKVVEATPPSKNSDFGADCWLVTFETLTIKLFGFPLVNQKFSDTKRVWRTTYVDENTRIVRAGRTGKSDDEILFYMTRNVVS